MRKLYILSAFLFLTNTIFAQIDVKATDKYIENARKAWNVPGMSVAIVKDGQVVLSKGYGLRELDKKSKVDEHTQFAIASNTKAFVSSSLSRLVDEGRLSWNDKVQDYLPYFALYGDYESTNTTIKDLLSHRVGLGTYSGDVIWYKSERSTEEVIKRVKHVPKAYDFRAGYGYTNLMFITAGEVIRVVTGKSWKVYVKENFIDPLGMSNTVMSTNDLKENNATPHKPTLKNGTVPIAWTNWDNMSAAGAIISSSTDMAQWMMMNLNGGTWKGDTLINKGQQNRLWTPNNNYYISDESKERTPGRHFAGYGLGWGVMDYFGTMVVSHGGGYDGMYSRVVMVPDLKLGVVVLTNSMEGISGPLTYYVLNQYLKKDIRDWSGEALERTRSGNDHKDQVEKRRASRVSSTSTSIKTENMVGDYTDPMYGDITISEADGNLRMEFEDAPLLGADLTHWHYDTYEIIWDEEHAWFDFGTVSFSKSNNMEVEGLSFDVPNYDIFFHELNMKKVK